MIIYLVAIASTVAAFVLIWFCAFFIPDYIIERNHIEYLKLQKEWLENEHQCKYYKENPFIKCHEKEGKEDCRWCPYIPFKEECKYYNI